MEVAAMALMATGTVASWRAQQGETSAQVKSYQFNADVNERDIVTEKNRQKFREIQLSNDFQRAQGAALAAYGKSGVGFSGSVWDVIQDQASQFELDRQISQFESQTAVNSLTDQANLNRSMAVTTKKTGDLKSMATLLTGLGSMGMAAYKAGVFSTPSTTNMTTAANNFSGPNGAALRSADAQFSSMFKSAGLQPINTNRRIY